MNRSLARALAAAQRARLRLAYRRGGIEAINAFVFRPGRVVDVLDQFGAQIGPRAILHGPLIIHNAVADYANLVLGEYVHIGRNVLLDLTDVLTLEDDACVSMGCTILTHSDIGERPLADIFPREVQPTRIGRGAYLGANVVVLCGCDVGDYSMVAAGAVVTAPVPERTLVAGVPARVVRRLDQV